MPNKSLKNNKPYTKTKVCQTMPTENAQKAEKSLKKKN